MTYIRVRWLHQHWDEPIWLISELATDRYEIRKVEIFVDGSKGYAGRGETYGKTCLGELPVPPLQEIGADPQFLPEEIAQADFEAVWGIRQAAS